MTISQAHKKKQEEDESDKTTVTLGQQVIATVKSVKDRRAEAEAEHEAEIQQEAERQRLEAKAEAEAKAEKESLARRKPEPEPVRFMELSRTFHGGQDAKAKELAKRAIQEGRFSRAGTLGARILAYFERKG